MDRNFASTNADALITQKLTYLGSKSLITLVLDCFRTPPQIRLERTMKDETQVSEERQ